MSEPKWTPGPWVRDDGDNDIRSESGELLACAYPMDSGGYEVAYANAQLIVAVKDLYAACMAALSNQYEQTALDEDLVATLESALAKARGEA